MRPLDFERLFVERGVEFVSHGPNVKRGNINIRCPFCGSGDPSHHMGIDLTTGWWGCWRNSEHRGKSPVRLLCQLLQLPVHEVRRMLGILNTVDLETFGLVRERLLNTAADPVESSAVASLELPPHFIPICSHDERVGAFLEYLVHDRGFGVSTRQLALRFNLHAAYRGDYKQRVIFPYTFDGVLCTWSGRAITHATLRYRDLEKEKSVIYKNDLLYNYDYAALGGRALIVVEGPVDVVKLDWCARYYSAHAVGISTASISDAQQDLLAQLAEAYDQVFIGMDQETSFARIKSVRMVGRLAGIVDAKPLPRFPYKDFGAAPLDAIHDFVHKLTGGIR